MLNQLEQAQKKWGGQQQVIDKWLTERQDVLVGYCELAGLPPFQTDSALPQAADVKRFCQLLIDYISVGHFEVFNAINQSESAESSHTQAVIAAINKSTDQALKFNDNYVKLDEVTALNNLDNDLALLGPFLEERFELEDQLIAILHQPKND